MSFTLTGRPPLRTPALNLFPHVRVLRSQSRPQTTTHHHSRPKERRRTRNIQSVSCPAGGRGQEWVKNGPPGHLRQASTVSQPRCRAVVAGVRRAAQRTLRAVEIRASLGCRRSRAHAPWFGQRPLAYPEFDGVEGHERKDPGARLHRRSVTRYRPLPVSAIEWPMLLSLR